MAKKAEKKDVKVHKSLRLDKRIYDHFEKVSEKTGFTVNALINAELLKIVKKK